MLAKGAMKVMFIAKVKTAALVTAASLVVAGGGTIVAQEVAAQRKAAEQPATEVQAAVPANLATNGVEDIALPDTAEALFRYGQQMEKQGKIAIACRAYKTFFERYPDHSQIHEVGYCLGRCLYASGDADKAIKTLEEATRIRNANFRNRPEALFFLSRLYGDTGDYDKACKTLETLLGEGAGLYEEAALNMCGHYYAKLQKYDEAAAKYSVLERRTNSPYAKDAAYGLAMVRLMAEKLDLARNAIDSFAQRYPGNARIAELSMRMARVYYAKKQLKNAMDICQQILTGFKDAPEAIEAAFLIAIIHRDSEQFEQAADCLLRIAHMPQATNNAALVAEAIFENAQIFRQQLKQPDKAADRYHEAATRSRDPVTERQRSILEQSLFYEAEFRFQQQKWGAAFDLYDQLRKLGSKLNVEERMLYCKSKMNAVEKAVGRETETGKQGTGNL
jgi:TolA-binding protein